MKQTQCKIVSGSLLALAMLSGGRSYALAPGQLLYDRATAPVRPLSDGGNVYMTSVETTYAAAGTQMPVTYHVYVPVDGGGLNFELTAKTSSGAIDTSHTFRSVHVSPIARDADGKWGQGTGRFFSDGAGHESYITPFNTVGWYRVQFSYNAPNTNRTLVFRATDYSGTPLKIGWADPSGEQNVSVHATFKAETASYVYFKGGAYSSMQPSAYAYADNIKVDSKLLYRRAFDQEQFNYPIGYVSAGDHTVDATFSGSARGKIWFGVNEISFDPNGVKNAFAPAQFVYDGEMRTGDYDAWNEGVAFAQGSSVAVGVRPPPVRRGNVFAVTLENSALNGQSMNATLRIYPLGNGSETNWPATRVTSSDYAGGIYTTSGFSTRYRELWRVAVPATAPIGRYVLRAYTPNGTQIGSDVLFYVIHNPFALSSPVTAADIAGYAYDDDTDGVNMELDAPFGSDTDDARDMFLVHLENADPGTYFQHLMVTGSMRRTSIDESLSMLDYAVAAATGTTNELQTMRRLFRIGSQRLRYGGAEQDDVTNAFVGSPDSFTPEDAYTYSRPNTELPDELKTSGMCYTSAEVLASLARSVGLLSRLTLSGSSLAGWGDHGFTEVFIPNLPAHGGKVTSSNSSAASDTDSWYVFDATSPEGPDWELPRSWTRYCEAIATRSQYGRVARILQGNSLPPFDVVTTSTTWTPGLPVDVPTSDVLIESAAFQSGVEFWMTSGSLTGWLGRGEKDVYRINKAKTGAKAVRVRALSNDGEYLTPKLCVGLASANPVMGTQCAAATWSALPTGDSYIVVYNDADGMVRRGDSIQYILELEY